MALDAKLDHGARYRLGDVEDAVQVGIDNLEPAFLGALEKALPAHRAGVVHKDVDAAEALDDLLHALLDAVVVAHVAVHAHDVVVVAEDLFHRVVFDIEDDDLGAFLDKLLGQAAAEAVGTAGDKGDLIDKSLHFHG